MFQAAILRNPPLLLFRFKDFDHRLPLFSRWGFLLHWLRSESQPRLVVFTASSFHHLFELDIAELPGEFNCRLPLPSCRRVGVRWAALSFLPPFPCLIEHFHILVTGGLE